MSKLYAAVYESKYGSSVLLLYADRQPTVADFMFAYEEVGFQLDLDRESIEVEQGPVETRTLHTDPSMYNDEDRLETFFAAYVECALWSSHDESTPDGGEPMDNNYSTEDIAEETLEEMRKDCLDFLTAHPEESDIPSFLAVLSDEQLELAGHDFWLTRNGHGAGFWDGDWDDLEEFGGESWGEKLTERSKPYGSVDLYVGDDGKIYG